MDNASKIEIYLSALQLECHLLAREKGFWDNERNFGEAIALVHSELSEALEAHRKSAMDNHLPNFAGAEIELADAVIRILDLAGGMGFDLSRAITAKLEYNRSRPYKHGKKY